MHLAVSIIIINTRYYHRSIGHVFVSPMWKNTKEICPGYAYLVNYYQYQFILCIGLYMYKCINIFSAYYWAQRKSGNTTIEKEDISYFASIENKLGDNRP